MASRRKSWDQLSPTYRERLQRQGITPEQHAEGVSLAGARGQGSSQKENERRRQQRKIRKWSKLYSRFYYRDEDEIREELEEYDREQVVEAIDLQLLMQELYDRGEISKAHALWEMRDTDMPEWMYFYHGAFAY